MINTLLVIAALIVAAIAVLLVLAAMRPNTFEVRRATTVKAPPEKIFSLINDLKSFGLWSPYERKDPAMKRVFSGPQSGTGATYDWDGDRNVGKGRLTIVDSAPPGRVIINLDMLSPIEAHNIVEFTLETKGGATEVTWALRGSVPFAAKVLHTLFDMDKMVGRDFEEGLASLKALAET